MDEHLNVDALMRDLGLDEAELASRKDFLELAEQDIATLRDIHDQLEGERLSFADDFYRHLLAFEPLSKLIGEPAQIEGLKQTQGRYFSEISLGDYGPAYVAKRLRVGLVHQKIGLEPKWYLGAYRKYLSSMLRLIWRECAGDVEKFLRAYDAIIKVVVFDVGLALDTYFEADRAQLVASEERFFATFNQAAVGIAHVAPDGRWLQVNRRLCEIVGYAEEELLARTQHDITHPEDAETNQSQLRRVLSGMIQTYSMEKRYIRKDGSVVWIGLTVSLVRNADDSPKYFIFVVEDISDRKRTEAQLSHLATHDELTALPNRNLLWDLLNQAIAFSRRDGHLVSVLFVDLDRFKNVNDSLGHPVGDQVIVAVAERLAKCVRNTDTVARLGGDEFAIVLTEVASEGDVRRLAASILDALREPITAGGQELIVTASIGIAFYPRDGEKPDELLKNADTAMYHAKEAGRDTFQYYRQEMNVRMLDRLQLESKLRRALKHKEFRLVYQPQFDLSNGSILGMEALIQWLPSEGGMIPPSDFIPLAEETGLIVPIGDWVLQEACIQAARWNQAGLQPMRIAVNISARQLRQNFVKRVMEILRDTGCSAYRLELEITESAVMEQPEHSEKILRELSELGVRIAIDDFGTGYSSLGYLKRFPIRTLKIDRSFIHEITTDPDDAAIAMGILALSHSMRLDVVAEGIETEEQKSFLRKHGCKIGQGFLLARPMRTEDITDFMKRRGKFV